MFVYILSLQSRPVNGGEGIREVSADHEIPPLDCRVVLRVPGLNE